MMVLAVVLAAGAVLVVNFLLDRPGERTAVAEPAALTTTGKLPEDHSSRPEPEPQTKAAKQSSGPRTPPRPATHKEPGVQSRQEPRRAQRPEPRPEPRQETPSAAMSMGDEDWPAPTKNELALASAPRYFDPGPGPGAAMALSVAALGVYDVPVIDSDSQQALDRGIIHVPETSMPWDSGTGGQRNVYLAGHRLGYTGTGSRLIFYNLDKLRRGDEVLLKARGGRSYRYRVTEKFVAGPEDSWVMGQVRGRDMVTLQTCTPIPAFDKRLIVRADRV